MMRILGRAVKISVAALVLIAAWQWSRVGRPAKRGLRLHALGRRMARIAEWLGPSFIKIGQLFSTRPDLLPPQITSELARLQDRVRPTPRRKLVRWWRVVAPAALLSEGWALDPDPLAAGSVAQVHMIHNERGETLAVKIQRPGLAKAMATDLAFMQRLAHFLSRTKLFRDVPVASAMEEIVRALEVQLDFARERTILEHYRELLIECTDICLPKTYADLSNGYVLGQELLTGLVRIDDVSLDDANARYYCDLLLHALYRMIFVGGVVHCDLHPANVYVRGTQLVLLDAGFSVRLSPATQRDFARFFRALAFRESRLCADIMVRTASVRRAHFDPDCFGRDVDLIIAANSSQRARDFSVARFAIALFECQRDHGLVASSEFTMAVWALLVVEGIVRQRWPDVDFQSKAVPYLTGSILADIAA